MKNRLEEKGKKKTKDNNNSVKTQNFASQQNGKALNEVK